MTLIDTSETDALLTTTRAVRRRLDLERPVPLALVRECLSIALQAPSGANLQGWHFVVVTDPAKRRELATIYKSAWDAYLPTVTFDFEPGDPPAISLPGLVTSGQFLADNLHRVPVFVVPCITPRVDGQSYVATATILGSIFPAIWSFMLAARSRGLGTTMTTLTTMFDRAVSDVLEIPDHAAHCALVPVAYYTGDAFKPAQRLTLATTVSYDSWSGAEPT